jgi:hypothetical protein
VPERGRGIGADRQDLRFIRIKFCDTRLVRCKLGGSTTGERSYEEGQNNDLLAAKIGKFHGFVVGVGEGEVRSFVTDL